LNEAIDIDLKSLLRVILPTGDCYMTDIVKMAEQIDLLL